MTAGDTWVTVKSISRHFGPKFQFYTFKRVDVVYWKLWIQGKEKGWTMNRGNKWFSLIETGLYHVCVCVCVCITCVSVFVSVSRVCLCLYHVCVCVCITCVSVFVSVSRVCLCLCLYFSRFFSIYGYVRLCKIQIIIVNIMSSGGLGLVPVH